MVKLEAVIRERQALYYERHGTEAG